MASIFISGTNALDRGGSFTGPVDVSVVDGRITAVRPGLRPQEGQPHIDGTGLWLMPGVFDCHLHAGLASFDQLELMRTPFSRRVLETAHTLRRTLAAGVTFVRDAGALDAGVRDAVAAGLTPGPELQVSVVALGTTGGHGDGFLAGPGLEGPADYMLPDYPGRPPYLADGPDGFRTAVRRLVRSGADWIKLLATGGVLSATEGATEGAAEGAAEAEFAAELGQDEISAAIAEATSRGRPVMVHALGGHGRNLAEITLLHRAGLSLEAALLAATAGGAELCGVGARLGRIEPGRPAVRLPVPPALPARRGHLPPAGPGPAPGPAGQQPPRGLPLRRRPGVLGRQGPRRHRPQHADPFGLMLVPWYQTDRVPAHLPPPRPSSTSNRSPRLSSFPLPVPAPRILISITDFSD